MPGRTRTARRPRRDRCRCSGCRGARRCGPRRAAAPCRSGRSRCAGRCARRTRPRAPCSARPSPRSPCAPSPAAARPGRARRRIRPRRTPRPRRGACAAASSAGRGARRLWYHAVAAYVGRNSDRRQVVAVLEAQRLEVERARHQHHAVQVHAVALEQVAREARGARRAVALADQVLGARPAAVARGVQADELRRRSRGRACTRGTPSPSRPRPCGCSRCRPGR